jgi:hypothetical protein
MLNMLDNFITTGIEKKTLFTLDSDVFVNNISSYLYVDDLDNLYRTCRAMKSQLYNSGRHICNKICKHHQPHSVNDLPAVVCPDGSQYWYKEGVYHRDGDLPAQIYSNGDQYWFKEDKLHRDGDLPAEILSDGSKHWFKEGKCHRDGDLPATIYSYGDQYWYKEGNLHRDGDLPAVIYLSGHQEWWKDGERYLNTSVLKPTKRQLYLSIIENSK